MIHDAVDFIKTVLNEYLSAKTAVSSSTGAGGGSNGAPVVQYPKIDADPPSFHSSALNLLLVNIQEEKSLRPPDPYAQVSREGIVNQVSPPIHLQVHLMVAAKSQSYSTALMYLSHAIQFFQAHPVFNRHHSPVFPSNIEKLTLEFTSLNDTQKNEIWSSLKTAYLPSVFYKMGMLVYQEDIPSMEGEIKTTQVSIQQQ